MNNTKTVGGEKAAPTFEHWTGQYIDGLDACLFSGDEFIGNSPIDQLKRAALRVFLARWTKQLDAIEAEEARMAADGCKCGICNGTGFVVRDPDIGTDQECFGCDGSGKETS